jgi:hypothetical protein
MLPCTTWQVIISESLHDTHASGSENWCFTQIYSVRAGIGSQLGSTTVGLILGNGITKGAVHSWKMCSHMITDISKNQILLGEHSLGDFTTVTRAAPASGSDHSQISPGFQQFTTANQEVFPDTEIGLSAIICQEFKRWVTNDY